MSVAVTTAPALSEGTPTFLFDAETLNVFLGDVCPDGRRLSVVLDWTREMEAEMQAAAK